MNDTPVEKCCEHNWVYPSRGSDNRMNSLMECTMCIATKPYKFPLHKEPNTESQSVEPPKGDVNMGWDDKTFAIKWLANFGIPEKQSDALLTKLLSRQVEETIDECIAMLPKEHLPDALTVYYEGFNSYRTTALERLSALKSK